MNSLIKLHTDIILNTPLLMNESITPQAACISWQLGL